MAIRRRLGKAQTRKAVTKALNSLKSAGISSTRDLKQIVKADPELKDAIKRLDRKVVPGPVSDWSCCFNYQK